MKKPKLIPKIVITDIKTPFPYKDGSVEEVVCHYVFNRVPSKQRGTFMDEIYRILKVGGKANIIVPYWTSMRAIADFANEWPPVCELTFCYFKKSERDTAKVHPELKCNFDFAYAYAPTPEIQGRAQDVQAEWIKYKLNTVLDLNVTLTKL